MSDPSSQLRKATRRAKSDVANKLISMFLHELSRTLTSNSAVRVDSEKYSNEVHRVFGRLCPYCETDLLETTSIVEHLDGMNRYRLGLHIPGNVLVACRRCNNEKRRDDARTHLVLADSGWESFLSHRGQCEGNCRSCAYWTEMMPISEIKVARLNARVDRIRYFRSLFPEFENVRAEIDQSLPELVGNLYTDCQEFAKSEIGKLLAIFSKRSTDS